MGTNIYKSFMDNFNRIPLVLKIVCAASFVLGVLQLIALFIPAVSPQILGLKLTSPSLIIIMGVIHIFIGWGIYTKYFIAMLFVILLPCFQLGILYSEIPFPQMEKLQTIIILSVIWAIFFIVYYYVSSARAYFNMSNNA